MNQFKLSIIITAEDIRSLKATVESLTEQADLTSGSVELIVVDLVCTDESSRIISQLPDYYNVVINELPHGSVYDGVFAGLNMAHADVLSICRSGIKYSKSALKAVIEGFDNDNTPMLSLRPVTVKKSGKTTDYIIGSKPPRHCDLHTYPDRAHLAVGAWFFLRSLLPPDGIDSTIHNEFLDKLLIELLLAAGSFTYIDEESCTHTVALSNDPSLFADQYLESWYTPSIENFYLPFLKQLREQYEEIPKAAQYLITHLIFTKYICNFSDRDKGILSDKAQVSRFHQAVCEAFCYIGNDVIADWGNAHTWSGKYETRHSTLARSIWCLIIFDKARYSGKTVITYVKDGVIYLHSEDEPPAKIGSAADEYIEINTLNYENGRIEIDGSFSGCDFIKPENIVLFGQDQNDDFEVEHCEIYPLMRCFGVTYARRYNIRASISAKAGTKARFLCTLGDQSFELRVRFEGEFSRLTTGMNRMYWCFVKDRALNCPDRMTLSVTRHSGLAKLKREATFCLDMFKTTANKPYALACIGLRMLSHITRAFDRRRIWMTFDKLYKGGDNGEYFFRHAQTRCDGINTYYIMNRGAKGFKELRRFSRRCIPYKSLRCLMLSLRSEAIVATHSTIIPYLGFTKPMQPFFRDLFNFRVICIQHGLTVQKLAQYQSRTVDNTTLYCLASRHERDNLLKPIYGYEPKHLRMSGMARFDGLINNDQNFILITPTWRRNVVTAGIAYIKKSHNDQFKNSEYFRIYNNLINDKQLIDCAREHGCGIVYLLHPAMSAQLEDFDRNDYVKLLSAADDVCYEKILTEASLMLTDYSGVQFDFAYMRKPVVYYHPDTLPPQYDSGSIDYPTMGFGPICTTHEQVVDALCEAICSGFANPQMYIERDNDFFEHDDHDNCRRIYNDILEYMSDDQ